MICRRKFDDEAADEFCGGAALIDFVHEQME
jgi:hypothetical protein